MTPTLGRTRARRPTPERRSNDLRRGSLWAVSAMAATALGGFAFWVLAALTSDHARDVGRAAAWFTLVQLVVTLGSLGAPILINRRGGDPSAADISGRTFVGVTVMCGVLGLLAPRLAGSEWATMSGRRGLELALLTALAAIGAALALVGDARLMSLRSWPLVFARAAVPAAARIPLLFVDPLEDRASWLAIVALGPLALSGAVASIHLRCRGAIVLSSPRGLDSPDRRFLAVQHVGALATHAPYHVIPLLVARTVSGPTNAAFYLVWGIGVMAAMVPQTLTQVLLSETSIETSGRLRSVRLTLIANVAIGAAGWAASLALAAPVLALIGPDYEAIADIVPWLLLASTAWGVTSICLTEARLAHDGQTTSLITWSIAALSITLGAAMTRQNPVDGAALAWLIAHMSAMAIGVIAIDRRRRTNAQEYRYG